jgi:hypothetical protein
MEPVTPDPLATNLKRQRRARVSRARVSRSRVSNGKALFAKNTVSGNSPWVRRLRDLLEDHIADLGGHDNISGAERSICRRAAVLTVELELLEQKFARAGGAAIRDLDLYSRTTGALRRCFEAIGLQRRSRLINPPTLAEIARDIEAEKAAAIEVETEGDDEREGAA